VWREVGDWQARQREIFVPDPDGYLVMVADDLGAAVVAGKAMNGVSRISSPALPAGRRRRRRALVGRPAL
jgi:hypothetical protein